MSTFKSLALAASIGLAASLVPQAHSAPGDDIFETCPSSEDIGDNVECYPVTFTSKTLVHPDGIPIIGYLFVPKNRPDEPLSAIVFAHGSGSLYSDGNHNKGLNSKHLQWVRQYTSEQGIVSLHVSSFHSRYLLPDTPGDQRIMEIDVPPKGPAGGDDYRATSYLGSRDNDEREDIAFDPNPSSEDDRWKDSNNGEAGVSEVMERAYDMIAAWDFLAGIRKGRFIQHSRNEDNEEPSLGSPMAGIGYIDDIVTNGIVIDHERIFLYGTSHGAQTAMAAAHAPSALSNSNPMNADLPDGFDRKRFAAFFDYYGGCGLFGAFGGTSGSTWRPYAPFIMLAGEHDSTAFDDVPLDSREKLEGEGCFKRIDAAHADPDFDQFLEMIVYDDAYHSFDGVKRDDFDNEDDTGKGGFTDWLAKIHANYRITLPFMQAIGRQVSAARNNQDIPSLAELGFSDRLPVFDTIPYTPHLGPQPVPGSAFHAGEAIVIDDLRDAEIDLGTQLQDPFDYFAPTCTLYSTPAGVSETTECVVQVQLPQPDTAPLDFWIRVNTEQGQTLVPARIEQTENTAGVLLFQQEFHTLPSDSIVTSERIDGDVSVATDGFVWTRFPDEGAHAFEIGPFSLGGYEVSERILSVSVGAEPATPVFNAYINRNMVRTDLEISEADSSSVKIVYGKTIAASINNNNFPTDALPDTDYLTNFVALDPIGDGSTNDDTDGDGNPDDPGRTGPDNEPRSNNGSSGGGAIFWMLPIVMLFRRR